MSPFSARPSFVKWSLQYSHTNKWYGHHLWVGMVYMHLTSIRQSNRHLQTRPIPQVLQIMLWYPNLLLKIQNTNTSIWCTAWRWRRSIWLNIKEKKRCRGHTSTWWTQKKHLTGEFVTTVTCGCTIVMNQYWY